MSEGGGALSWITWDMWALLIIAALAGAGVVVCGVCVPCVRYVKRVLWWRRVRPYSASNSYIGTRPNVRLS